MWDFFLVIRKKDDMAELTQMLSTSCGIISDNHEDDEVSSLPIVLSSHDADEPITSFTMEERTIHHSDAVDNEDNTYIYYNCDDFKTRFEKVQSDNDIRSCNGLLHRTLTYRDMYEALNIIYEFLETRSPNSMCVYGASSWGMVSHGLYCDINGKLYGYYSGSFGLTMYTVEKYFIEDMYEHGDERLEKIGSMTF